MINFVKKHFYCDSFDSMYPYIICEITFFLSSESCFATLPRTERGTAIVVNGDPKGKNFLYTNGNSIIIRDIAVSTIAISDPIVANIIHCKPLH